jgi:hypothetical protein
MQLSGLQNRINRTSSYVGDPVTRSLSYMERLDAIMLRGLMRTSALAATSGLMTNEFEGYGSECRFLAELALAGEFRFVEGPTYYKRIHGRNLHLKWYGWPNEHKREAWVLLAAWMIEVIVPAGRTTEERWRLLHIVVERFLFSRGWLSRTRNQARSLYQRDRSRSSRLLLALIDRLRNSATVDAWLRERSRHMFYEVDKKDLAAHGNLLSAVLDRLQTNGRFDPTHLLETNWTLVRERAAQKLGIDHKLVL